MIKLRKASSMIELVIAIVVMGIAVMTLPLMLQKAQENSAFTMQQEAIVATRTAIGDIITYPWDENSIQNGRVGVLDVSNLADNELTRFPDTNSTRRVGHVRADKRRKFFGFGSSVATAPIQLGQDAGDFDDIDDFIDTGKDYNVSGDASDYKFDLDMNTTINYVSDATDYSNQIVSITFDRNSVNYSSNIKRISIILSGTGVNTFRLDAYSSNIGGSEILRRNYQ